MTRMKCFTRQLLIAALALVLPATVSAQQRQGRTGSNPPQRQEQQQQQRQEPQREEPKQQQTEQRRETPSGVLRLLPADSVTDHSIELASGKTLAYTATAGTLALYDQSGEQTAAVFYTAYVAKGGNNAPRPVTFGFNGGPGAASAYLHLGLVGPKILQFGDRNDAATAQLRSNPQTWLEFSDLVMIDPVGSGWSRAAKPDGNDAFRGVRRDADFFAKVIALYTAKNGRSASPKYLLGESYGGFRAAKVARALQQDQGIAISGIVMVSPMLEGAFQFGGDRFALGAALYLPSLAAAEFERSNTMSKEALAQAERFALSEYLTTLAGPPPQGEAARIFYAKVAKMTGIPEEDVAKSRGFLRDYYLKSLRSANGMTVSRYDGSFAMDDPFPDSRGDRGPDPVLDGFTRAYAGAFVGYAREQLGFHTDMSYVLLSGETSGNWNWREGGRSEPSASDDLRILLAFNPSFRLIIAHGYADLVTPYMASRYVLDHLPPFTQPDRAQLKLYSGGHMFYVADEPRKSFSADMKAFFSAGKGS
jgi:carboxypeptidase C (cathepsin A)